MGLFLRGGVGMIGGEARYVTLGNGSCYVSSKLYLVYGSLNILD